MKAFDTDILTQILRGNPVYAERVALIPVAEQALPIVAAEEVLRSRLNTIRQAEAGKAKITIEQAYQFLEQTLKDIRELTVLEYTPLHKLKPNTKHGASRSFAAPRMICASRRFALLMP